MRNEGEADAFGAMSDQRKWQIAFIFIYVPMFMNGFFDLRFDGSPWAFLLDAAYFVVLPTVTFVLITLKNDESILHSVTLELRPIRLRAVAWGFFFGFLFAAGSAHLLDILTVNQHRLNSETDFQRLDDIRQSVNWTMVFYAAISAGLVEEILYKPVLKRALPMRHSARTYVLTATVLFAAAHFEQGWRGFLLAAIFASISAGYYAGGGSLLLLVTAHAFADFLTFSSN